jgi:hypothetical protein
MTAKLMAVVDLPSEGPGLEKSTERIGSSSELMNMIFMRRFRYASAAGSRGSIGDDERSPTASERRCTFHVVIEASKARNHPENGDPEKRLDVRAGSDGSVEVLQEEGRSDSEDEPEQGPEQDGDATGTGHRSRAHRRVENIDVRRCGSAGDARLVQLRQDELTRLEVDLNLSFERSHLAFEHRKLGHLHP